MTSPALRTPLCELLGIEYPIVLAGMGVRGLSTPPRLVAAVSNAGGLGVLGAAGLAPDVIDERIREVRRSTARPFGVDLLLPASLAEAPESAAAARERIAREYPRHVAFVERLARDFGLSLQSSAGAVMSPAFIARQVDVVLEARVPVFAAGLGDPSWVVPRARERGITVMGLAGTVRNAERHVAAGVDVVVAQGHEAGGHTGRIATFPLLPQVVDAIYPTPVVAAGGIADGRGVAAALALGAVGVWVGTAFLVAEECDWPAENKKQILRGRSEDFVISRSYTGKTARQYRNPIVEAWEQSGLDPLPMPLQGLLMAGLSEAAWRQGRSDLVFNPAGQIGGMLTETRPAADIMADLVTGAAEAIARLQRVTVR